MRPLSPPLKVIEGNLFMPSVSLLLRWTTNEPGLSPKKVKALENDPIAKELRTELKKQGDAPVIENKEDDAPLPSFLEELIERRLAARNCYASSSIPNPGQILRLDQIIGPDKNVVQDLSSPLAVLIEKSAQTKNRWQGWMVASETDYAGYWDMLLEPEDEPFDPLAGLIQIWNPVQVYLPSEAPVLAELKPARLQAVRALAEEFATDPKLDASMNRPGHIAPRITVGNFSILTGTPLGNLNTDPRYRYKTLYQDAADMLQEVTLQSSHTQVNLTQWLQGQFDDSMKIGWQELKNIFCKPIPAFMANVVIKQAKRIQLDNIQTVVLITKLEKTENQQLKLIFQVTVTDEPDAPNYLPPTLKLTVTDQSANVLEVAAGDNDDYLEQEWLFEIGEKFRVILTLNDIEITEHFAV
jgi:hypothetical protein